MRNPAALLLLPLFIWSCNTTKPAESTAASPAASQAPATPPPPQPIKFASKKTGKEYSFVRLQESDDEIEKFEPPTPGLAAPSPDNFHGTDRKAAKTSISTGPSKTFGSVAALLSSGLFLPDAQMTAHNPPISKDATSNRLPEEQHNVVVSGFLYASSKESDNDFHCIFGNAAGDPAQFVNVEVSGLPTAGTAKATLKTVRDAFKEFFGDNLPGQGYSKFDPPIPVRITGSIFFDIDHPAGAVGPTGLKPKTAWEIHPVTKIEFEPES